MNQKETSMARLAINKSLLKEYYADNCERCVYLNNGDEFQIQLFNPEQFTIGAEIRINDKLIGGKLVIKPGERIWLERYLNDKSKFKFNTYEVDDPSENLEVANAIRYNGLINIRFYKECDNSIPVVEPITLAINDVYYDTKTYVNTNNIPLGNSTICTNSAVSNSILGLDPTAKLCASTISTASYAATNSAITKSIETGRIEKGSYSNQNINYVNTKFDVTWYLQTTLKILPSSRKPYTSYDLKKIYCTQCGRKLKEQYKFCPYCGSKCE